MDAIRSKGEIIMRKLLNTIKAHMAFQANIKALQKRLEEVRGCLE